MNHADGPESADAAWSRIEAHFRHHAALVRRFKSTNAVDAARMWQRGSNEQGKPLSPFEREALL